MGNREAQQSRGLRAFLQACACVAHSRVFWCAMPPRCQQDDMYRVPCLYVLGNCPATTENLIVRVRRKNDHCVGVRNG